MRRFAPLAALAVLASLALAGCASAPLTADPEPEVTTGTSQDGTAPTGGAEADPELAAFRAALAGQSPADPDALIAAVEAAGFERSAIERTRELDSLGAPVTFLEVAVRVEEGCLLGQVGDGEPLALRAAALGGGRCLVGDVVALD